MVKEFKVVLNALPNDNGVYFPGSVVSGTLIVDVAKPKNYKAIQVSLRGFSYVYYRNNPNGGKMTASDKLVEFVTVLWNKEQTADHTLPAGHHEFQFQFPPFSRNLPPTYRGLNGYVAYYVEGEILCSRLVANNKCYEQVITFNNVTKINVPRFMRPVHREAAGALCCLWCVSAPVSITATLPRAGFCIGEAIPLCVVLDNRSNRPISLNASLVESAVFLAHGNSRSAVQIPHSIVTSDPLPARQVTFWEPGAFHVPQYLTVSMKTPGQNCCISITYSLRITAILPCGPNLVVQSRLLIGNVPLDPST